MFTQLLIDGLFFGIRCSLLGVGFCLLYRTHRFMDFGFGLATTLAAYCSYAAHVIWSWPLITAVCFGALAATSLGLALHITLYRILRERGATQLVMLLASLGVYIVLQNMLILLFGAQNHALQNWAVVEGVHLADARVSLSQATNALITLLALAFVAIVLTRFRVGRQLRAAGNDPDLAISSGLPIGRVRLVAAGLGYCLGGIAGLFTALEANLWPGMGFDSLLAGAVSAIIGGTSSLVGAFSSGLVIGIVTHVGIWQLASEWQSTILFLILLAFLVVRPRGISG